MKIDTNKIKILDSQKILQLADEAYLGLGDTEKISVINHFIKRTDFDRRYPDLHLMKFMQNPVYITFTCKQLLNIDLLPIQAAVLAELWSKPFPMFVASRGFGKSFLLAVYSLLRLALAPGTKIVIVGSAFRQSKIVFEYMEGIWKRAPILRDIAQGVDDGPRVQPDRLTLRINDGYAIAIPIGDGGKIRGLRAHIVIADEFSSVPPDIYETVVAGFTAVSASPVLNVKEHARRKILQEYDSWREDQEEDFQSKKGNQAIISGTADYDFMHFGQYHKRWSQIINSRGNPRKLAEIFNNEEVPESFDWKDFCVIRIPYELIPRGFMDDKQVAKSRATITNAGYEMEYGAVFSADSQGFFKRSLIESCCARENNPIDGVWFSPTLIGSKDCAYVYGVDPAAESDNFSIVIMEIRPTHSRVVYCWTTTKQTFKEKERLNIINEHDFYGYCARKIRSLMQTFPCARIGMDAQGGGIAVAEALQDPDKILTGEKPILPIIDPDKPASTDHRAGLHILELVQFARAEWTAQANHGLKKDMEDKAILFPDFNPIDLAVMLQQDKESEDRGSSIRQYDNFEECIMEMEELKNELASIVKIITSNSSQARERWDTPEIKLPNGKKGRLRKDRYSALVIANMLSRQIHRAAPVAIYHVIGGFASDIASVERRAGKASALYSGSETYTKNLNAVLRVNLRR